MSSSAIRELIKVELTRIREIAEEANHECLPYFIDMAISEAETKPRRKRNIYTTAVNIWTNKPTSRAMRIYCSSTFSFDSCVTNRITASRKAGRLISINA